MVEAFQWRGDDPLVVRVDPTARIHLRIQERDRPVPGLWATLREAERGHRVRLGTSDVAGLHAFERISPGPYVYVVGGAGYWPTEHQVTASKDPAELEVQVRRVGTLEIEAIHAGAAVAAAQAAIRSVEYDKDVRTWAGRGFASVEPADSRTDSSGLLVVQDIPNGPYTWTVTFPDGHVATGNVTVPPHSRTRVRAER